MPPTLVTIDPTTPLGSESLKQGPQRFHEIKNELLQILGFTGVVQEQFGAPFAFSNPATPADGFLDVVGPPTTNLGIATKSYVDQRSGFNILSSGGPVNYTTNAPAGFSLVDSNTYILGNDGANNSGAIVSMAVGATTGVGLVHANGDALAANDFIHGGNYLVLYAAGINAFIMLQWIGGSVSQATTFGSTVTLNADPATNLEAATKQYVDTAMGTPTPVYPPGVSQIVASSDGVKDLAGYTAAVTIPNDGNTYVIHISYAAYLSTAGSDGAIYLWAIDNVGATTKFLPSIGKCGSGTGNGETVANAAGFSPVTYMGSSSPIVQIHVQGQVIGANFTINSGTGSVPSAPPAHLTTTLMRI